MGKYGKYKKRFKNEWLNLPEFKGWLAKNKNDDDEAFCNVCKVSLRSHKTDLKKHSNTKIHIEKANALNPKLQPKLQVVRTDVPNSTKIFDITLAVYISNHSSISSVDHLGEVIAKFSKGPLENIRLHRTKCSSIILNILDLCLLKELIVEVGDQPYSIIVDESTDVGNEKYMAYCIRYYNSTLKEFVVDFLALQQVIRETAQQLCKNFLKLLEQVGLNTNNFIAIATDGANNLCGKNESLYALLKKQFPRLQLLKCICHSLDQCARIACEKLPSNLEYLLRESRAWFSHSSLRKKIYEAIFQKLNDGKKPPKLPQLCTTRWLAFYPATKATIDQWDELKRHFQAICASNDRSQSCFVSRQLASMFEDETNYLYLIFVGSVLRDVNFINIAFQANEADINLLYRDLRLLILSIARRIFSPSFLRNADSTDSAFFTMIEYALEHANSSFQSSLLPINKIDMGTRFDSEASKVPSTDLYVIKSRCQEFLITLCDELFKRCPQNFRTVEHLKYFAPSVFMVSKESVDVLPWHLASENCDREAVESEWRRIKCCSTKDLFPNENPPSSVNKFWIEISQIKNATASPAFPELSKFALRALSLPLSNASVERVFSVMNSAKVKIRNRLSFRMLGAILRVRLHLKNRQICCKNFKPSLEMLKCHNKEMYNRENEDESADVDECFTEILDLIRS